MTCRRDLENILNENPLEVDGLLAALRAGKVDGSTYSGECACLVGTIANIKHCDFNTLGPDSGRPAEVFFTNIRPGDKPDGHAGAKMAEEWIVAWQEKNRRRIAAERAFVGVPTEEIEALAKQND